jgi:asparagine synthase (glutamine-hydrolysing)
MAHALEVRVPILDHQLVDWMSGLSPDMKLRGTEGKYLLKKALEPMLPHEILYRKKMGFAVPLASWFRGPLKEKVRNNLLSREMLDSGLFNQRYLETLVNHHQSGVRDYSASIWTLLMFHSFLKKMSA